MKNMAKMRCISQIHQRSSRISLPNFNKEPVSRNKYNNSQIKITTNLSPLQKPLKLAPSLKNHSPVRDRFCKRSYTSLRREGRLGFSITSDRKVVIKSQNNDY
jgi:hypothetical protein